MRLSRTISEINAVLGLKLQISDPVYATEKGFHLEFCKGDGAGKLE